jgi:hypothetical protein
MRPSGRSDGPIEEPAGQGQVLELVTGRPIDPDGPLRVGTLSWSVPKRVYGRLRTGEFLSALEQVAGRECRPDLLLVSGRTLADEPDALDLAERAAGIPVVLEIANRDGSARWLLANGRSPCLTLLRQSQILVRSGDSDDTYRRLVAEVVVGNGVIRFGANGMKLLLLICGENNALRWDSSNLSALYYPAAGLADLLGGRWVVLNPAHSPYWPQIRSKGFAKVGVVAGSGETMARPVARSRTYKDGTSSPIAFVHANNFYAEEPKTKAYASVAFGANGRMTPTHTGKGVVSGQCGEDIHWMFSGYEIPIR